ncbi:DUF4157 domain-containing protein [Chitinophaga solisilvae]|uniref:eCIS core domain-containing protein n=1 Tax=Chitinophaga solisilvae TaxID=1233460 RepID=UPI0013721A40|nr:DUF4157 domain-containing protein [Chitinophaga solisilvae]
MKSADQKSPAIARQPQRTATANPFFARAGAGGFDHASDTGAPFFTGTSPVQAKLKVHPADDVYEQEADAMADKVVQEAPAAAAGAPQGGDDEGIQKKPLHNGFRAAQRQRAFESPTAMEQNSAHAAGAMETPLQAKSSGDPSEAPSGVESQLDASKGSGEPLPEATRDKMESSFGNDFSDVRIHTGAAAAQMSDDLHARAFTHGKDIYFNEGEYKPDTPAGEHLLAHELTHTVQQAGGVGRKKAGWAIQKATPAAGATPSYKILLADVTPGADNNSFTVKSNNEQYALTNEQVNMPAISLPALKKRNAAKFKLPLLSVKGRPDTKQSKGWDLAVAAFVNPAVFRHVQELEKKPGFAAKSGDIYYLKLSGKASFHVIGTPEQIAKLCYNPKWDRNGKPKAHQVDHIVEMQLGGADQPENTPQNYELLSAKANMASGNLIKGERKKRVKAALELFTDLNKQQATLFTKIPSVEDVMSSYFQQYASIDNKDLGNIPEGDIRWSFEEIKAGKQLLKLEPMTAKEVDEAKGSPDEAMIYVSNKLGSSKKLKYPAPQTFADFYQGLDMQSNNLDTIRGTDADGLIKFKLNKKFTKKMKAGDELEFTLKKIPGRLNTYFIQTTKAFKKNTFTKFEGLSPVTINDIDLDESGLVVTGVIEPSIDLFKGMTIDFSIGAGELSFSADVPLAVLTKNFPKIFGITNASLEISYSTKDNKLNLAGNVNFNIPKLGEGEVRASSDAKGFAINGKFIFDKSKFDGEMRVGYSSESGWSFGGSARIGANKVKGVKDAQVSFDYANGMITVNGNANLTVPGIKALKIAANISKDGDFIITVETTLGEVPGLKGGSVTVTISSKKGEELDMAVAGTAVPDFPKVPGLGASVSFSYKKGIFEVRALIDYKKDRFDGKLELGLTNRNVDEKGKISGEPTEGAVIVFGYGELTVDLFKGSKGTISARFTPDKQLLVAGKFSIQNVSPFGEGVDINRKIVEFPSIKIPIVGVPGVSIFFEISGGAYFKFNWQPLMIKELSIGFQETNINEIENAQVDIHGDIGSKASAEAYMEIKASLGAEVLIAQIKGSLGGQAGIGIEGEAGGKVDATWNNEKGLQLKEVQAYITVNPKAIFRLTGSISVDLDLWLTTINLYYKEWVLAEGSADLSGLALKVNFPIKFDEEGNLIRPDFDKLNIEKPDFSGEQGKAALDGGINGDAQKERKLAKDKLRADIARDMKASVNDEDFSPTKYANGLKEKYAEDAEMQAFIMDSVEEEVKIREYEEFEAKKTELRKSEASLDSKMQDAFFFKMWRARISQGDFQAFIQELQAEEQKKHEAGQQQQSQDQPADQPA